MTSGTYLIRCGPAFYVGSTTSFKNRRIKHLWELKRGFHQNQRLQAAFDKTQDAQFVALKAVERQDTDSEETFRRRLRDAEQELLNFYAGDKGLTNKSTSAFGPDNGDIMRKKWEDPRFREHMAQVVRDRGPASETTKNRMAAAKRGGKNPKARTLEVVCPNGKTKRFDTVTAAAEFFKVSQQLMDQWVRGLTAWPGTGGRVSAKNQWITGYSPVKDDEIGFE